MKTNLHLFFIGLLFLSSNVLGQSTTPFTVLRTNTDTANRQVFVEVMYEKPACSDYQAKFRLDTKGGKGSIIKVDSFLNNQGTFVNVGDSILQRPQAGGYKLLFKLPSNVSVVDSPHICVLSQVIPYECEGCAASSSTALFTTNDISPCCPYVGNDLLACRQRRTGSTYTWEAWIQDSRDCNAYRIVMMPDGRWWFAQNLNYQKDLEYKVLNTASTSTLGLTSEYLCPSGLSAEQEKVVSAAANNASTSTAAITPTSCNTYGALYSWTTAMALNGRTTVSDGASRPTPLGESSISQGICPDGWMMPSDYDWDQMFNAVESQLSKGDTRGVVASLKGVHSCSPHASIVDSSCATYSYPAWAWRRANYDGKVSTPFALGSDIFGFSVLPSGVRLNNGAAYNGFGLASYFWSSSQYDANNGYYRTIEYSSIVNRLYNTKGTGFSVRCVRPGGISMSTDYVMATISELPDGFTVDWYDAPIGGQILLANNATYRSDMPVKVYADIHPVGGGSCGVRKEFVLSKSYTYTSNAEQRLILTSGSYKIELWGAQGGDNAVGARGGYGGYTSGIITLDKVDTFYMYIGQQAAKGYSAGGYNGGNRGGTTNGWGIGGGGATDLRKVSGAWNAIVGLRSRIMVAGGGGGNGGWNGTVNAAIGGYGGGLTAGAGTLLCTGCSAVPTNAGGGHQTAGGVRGTSALSGYNATSAGTFGVGGYGDNSYGGGGGGGFYGGGGGSINNSVVGSGGGGSSFISGHTGCVALASEAANTAKAGCATGNTDNNCSLHYSGYVFKNTIMIDGNGYRWTHIRGSIVGVGNVGHGRVRITPL